MRIAFISYDFPEYSIHHVNEMIDVGDVLLMLPEHTTQEYLPLLNPRVRFESFHKPRLRQPLWQVPTALRILRTVRKFRPDVVHFQNGHFYFNLALPLLKKFPLVITIHDARQHLGDHEAGRTPQWIMDFGFRRADQIIVHGRSLIRTVVDELGFEPSRIHLIPHVAVGHSDIRAAIRDEEQSILFFGRIWEYKGLEYLIRAEPLITAKFPRAKIVIGGRGENFERYRRLMVHPERFEIHNDWITDEQRAEMFAACSIVVLPYIEASQSGVIPVAYAHEKPVIATTIGGLPDMVDQGKTGLLVPPRDAQALADAIIQLLHDRELRIRMGRAGREKLVKECSPAVVVSQTVEVYRRAIQDRGQRAFAPIRE
jgi:glycosyltransferase involved in cell wall biosynthesis